MPPEHGKRFLRALSRAFDADRPSSHRTGELDWTAHPDRELFWQREVARWVSKADHYVQWQHLADREHPHGFIRGVYDQYKRQAMARMQKFDTHPLPEIEAIKERSKHFEWEDLRTPTLPAVVDVAVFSYALNMRPDLEPKAFSLTPMHRDILISWPTPKWALPSWKDTDEDKWRAEQQKWHVQRRFN